MNKNTLSETKFKEVNEKRENCETTTQFM